MQSIKQKYEEMSVTLQKILNAIGNVEQNSKKQNSKAAYHERRIQTRSQQKSVAFNKSK